MERNSLRDPRSKDWVGVVFTNPVTEERIEILEMDRDSEGPYARARITLPPGASGPPLHVHTEVQELFTVESGELTVHLEGKNLTFSEDESANVIPRSTHGYENQSDSSVVFTAEARPASRITHALSTLFGLAHEGAVDEDGNPSFLQAMVFAREMKDVIYLASPPYPIQWVLFNLFAPVGWIFGYRATYDRYLRPDFWDQRSRSVPEAEENRTGES